MVEDAGERVDVRRSTGWGGDDEASFPSMSYEKIKGNKGGKKEPSGVTQAVR